MKINVPALSAYPWLRCEFNHGSYSCPSLKLFGLSSERSLVLRAKRVLDSSRKDLAAKGIFLPESFWREKAEKFLGAQISRMEILSQPDESDL